jgi:phospho-N-acetylmuramoyl-pentapeptide-transferase
MLFHLLYPLSLNHPSLGFLNVVRYPSARIIFATLTALVMSFLLGPWFIGFLKRQQISESIRDDGPQTHKKKAGTPTMGGALILASILLPSLLWCDLTNRLVWATLLVTAGYGLIGFLDDYIKVSRRNKKGLPGKLKLVGQLLIGGAACGLVFYSNALPEAVRDRIALPFVSFDRVVVELPTWLYVAFATVVVVGASNAVNLTDGLDGLATGPVVINAGTLLLLSYGAGAVLDGFHLAEYLRLPPIAGAAELAVYCGAVCGAGLGFLWYNSYPASVFMGDVGSLSLGGGLGILAVLTKNELTLVLLGGVFVVEALSVMAQVASFRWTGKRIFKMAPIHHHFELKGWAEPKIIVRAWIISILLALVALASVKVR